MLLKDIIDIIESVAPLSTQAEWDNSGLQIGHNDADIASVLCCTDVTEAVIDEAIETHSDLILTHHPLLFQPLSTIQGLTFQERVAEKAIRHGICIYSSHTPMDRWLHGISGRMAEQLCVSDYQPLSADIYGVIGNLPKPLQAEELMALVKEKFHTSAIRYTQPVKTTISRVAFGGGECAEFLEDAIHGGAEAFISSDFKHHQFLQADGRIMVLDIGHFESEQFIKDIYRDLLKDAPIQLRFATTDLSPVKAYV